MGVSSGGRRRFERKGQRSGAKQNAPAAAGGSAWIEVLEPRVMLAFDAYMTALPSGAGNPNYTINLYTVGGIASQWQIHWGAPSDPNNVQTITKPPGGWTVPQPESHTYKDQNGNPILPSTVITATATIQNGTATSTAYFSGSQTFGTYQGFLSGITAQTAVDSTGNSNGKAMAVGLDGNGNPATFVASLYNGNQMAVTAFSAPNAPGGGGSPDTSFGGSSTPGTLVIPPFGTGTETDVPLAIGYDPAGEDNSELAVAGYATYGGTSHWAVAFIDMGAANPSGAVTWQNPNSAGTLTGLPSGTNAKATSIAFNENGPQGHDTVIVAGTDGTHMVAASIWEETTDRSGSSLGKLDTLFGSSGTETVSLPSGVQTMGANSIIQMTDTNSAYTYDFLMGGYTTHQESTTHNNCNLYIASDFTLVRLTATGAVDTSFGSGGTGIVRENFEVVGASPTCCYDSFDSTYSLLEWEDTAHSKWDVIAVGTTNVNQNGNPACQADHIGLARFNEETGAGDTAFSSHSGAIQGPTGDAYAAALQGTGGASPITDSGAEIVIAGAILGSLSTDMLTARFYNNTSGKTPGTLDPTFGNGGEQITDIGGGTDIAYSVIILQSSSNDTPTDILVGGSTNTTSSNGEMLLEDYLVNNYPSA